MVPDDFAGGSGAENSLGDFAWGAGTGMLPGFAWGAFGESLGYVESAWTESFISYRCWDNLPYIGSLKSLYSKHAFVYQARSEMFARPPSGTVCTET